jgi:hypothetical protein
MTNTAGRDTQRAEEPPPEVTSAVASAPLHQFDRPSAGVYGRPDATNMTVGIN